MRVCHSGQHSTFQYVVVSASWSRALLPSMQPPCTHAAISHGPPCNLHAASTAMAPCSPMRPHSCPLLAVRQPPRVKPPPPPHSPAPQAKLKDYEGALEDAQQVKPSRVKNKKTTGGSQYPSIEPMPTHPPLDSSTQQPYSSPPPSCCPPSPGQAAHDSSSLAHRSASPCSRPGARATPAWGPPTPLLPSLMQCIALQPAWVKGYSRLGAAYSGLEDHAAAVQAYQRGLQIHTSTADGSNSSGGDEQLQAALAEAQAAAAASCPFTNPDFLARMASEPRGRELLEQPDFQASKAAGEGRGGRGGDRGASAHLFSRRSGTSRQAGDRGGGPPLPSGAEDFQAGGRGPCSRIAPKFITPLPT